MSGYSESHTARYLDAAFFARPGALDTACVTHPPVPCSRGDPDSIGGPTLLAFHGVPGDEDHVSEQAAGRLKAVPQSIVNGSG
jgi:hypothetical protein